MTRIVACEMVFDPDDKDTWIQGLEIPTRADFLYCKFSSTKSNIIVFYFQIEQFYFTQHEPTNMIFDYPYFKIVVETDEIDRNEFYKTKYKTLDYLTTIEYKNQPLFIYSTFRNWNDGEEIGKWN